MSRYPEAQLRYVARFAYGGSLPGEARRDGEVHVFGSNGPVGSHDEANTGAPVIVIGRKGSHGKLQYNNEPVFAIDTTYFIDPSMTQQDVRWLFYALSTAHLDTLGRDVGVPGLNRDSAYAQRIPLPPLRQQRAIADFLDAETARIDALIAKKRRLIELLEDQFRSARWKVVTNSRLDEPTLEESSVRPGWARTRLKFLVGPPFGGVWGDEPGEGESDVICLRVADFDRWQGVVRTEEPTIRSIRRKELERLGLEQGDLLIEKSGGGERSPVGFVAAFPGSDRPAISSNFIARLRPRQGLEQRFVAEVFGAAYDAGLNVPFVKQTTGIQNLDLGGFLAQSWFIPSLSEQRHIADSLSVLRNVVSELRSKLHRQIELLAERRKALITAAVTGQLDLARAVAEEAS